jgi:biopolymer transport protein ExbD
MRLLVLTLCCACEQAVPTAPPAPREPIVVRVPPADARRVATCEPLAVVLEVDRAWVRSSPSCYGPRPTQASEWLRTELAELVAAAAPCTPELVISANPQTAYAEVVATMNVAKSIGVLHIVVGTERDIDADRQRAVPCSVKQAAKQASFDDLKFAIP